MTVDRIVHLVTGLMVLLSVALANFVDPSWVWLAAFIGLSLAQSGVTNFCPLAAVLRKAGVPDTEVCCR